MNKIGKNKRGRERYYKSLIPYKHQQNRQHGGNERRKSSISFSLSAVETHATHEWLSLLQKQSKGLIGFNYNPTVIVICNFFLYFDHFEGYSFNNNRGENQWKANKSCERKRFDGFYLPPSNAGSWSAAAYFSAGCCPAGNRIWNDCDIAYNSRLTSSGVVCRRVHFCVHTVCASFFCFVLQAAASSAAVGAVAVNIMGDDDRAWENRGLGPSRGGCKQLYAVLYTLEVHRLHIL